MDVSIVDSPYAPDGSILIEVADDREDLRTEEEQAQEQAYQHELKSRKPGGAIRKLVGYTKAGTIATGTKITC